MRYERWTQTRPLACWLLGLVVGALAMWAGEGSVGIADASITGKLLMSQLPPLDVHLCDGTVLRQVRIVSGPRDTGSRFLEMAPADSLHQQPFERYYTASAACGYWYIDENK